MGTALAIFGVLLLSAVLSLLTLFLGLVVYWIGEAISGWIKDEPTSALLFGFVLFVAYVVGLGTFFLQGAW